MGLVIAGPAQAKSAVEMTVSSFTVQVGDVVHVTASGGSDTAGDYSAICLEGLTAPRGHPPWRRLRCTKAVSNATASPVLHDALRVSHPGHLELRAQLFSARSAHGRLHPAQATAVTIVRVVSRPAVAVAAGSHARSGWPVLGYGSRGTNVRALQNLLPDLSDATRFLAVDGSFGPATRRAVRLYQESRALKVDGIVGPATWGKLTGHLVARYGDRGHSVAAAQTELNKYGYHLVVDGSFGPRTRRAVRSFQRTHRLTVDRILGPYTWHALLLG